VPHEEKRAWIMLLVSIPAYLAYVVLVLGRRDGRSLADVPYAATMLWSIVAAIVVSIVLTIAAAIASPRDTHKPDVRDREIGRFGDHVGQSVVVIGAVSAMLMAMSEWDYFWIANVIYLCFVLSAVLGSIAKVIAYRRGLPQW
jgi:hypothetical protein